MNVAVWMFFQNSLNWVPKIPRKIILRYPSLSQLSISSHSAVGTLCLIYRENGIVGGLYRGLSINYIRACPMVAISFSVYEVMKELLHLETGIKISTG